MRHLLAVCLTVGLSGCCSVNKKAVADIAGASANYATELQTYWDADVAAGKHEKVWSDAKKAQMKAYLDAVGSLQKASQ